MEQATRKERAAQSASIVPFRTIQARPTADTLIKPGELIDLVEVTPLTLTDRRIYNLLLENAWDAIDRNITHAISKAALRGSHDSNDRIGESIERLMSAIVKVKARSGEQTLIERVQLLGGNVEYQTPDGMLYYEIPGRLRRIIRNSTIFARLQKEVMFAVGSKYALALYEMVQKRGNLSYRSSEEFTLEQIRGLLGVPDGKLTEWFNLYNRAIRPAVKEVSELSDYTVEIEPLYRGGAGRGGRGRSVTGVRLRWAQKEGRGRRLERPSAPKAEGDKRGLVEPVERLPAPQPRTPSSPNQGGGWLLRTETYETARMRFPGYDIYHVEREWLDWARDKEPPRDPNRAFLAFFQKYADNHRL